MFFCADPEQTFVLIKLETDFCWFYMQVIIRLFVLMQSCSPTFGFDADPADLMDDPDLSYNLFYQQQQKMY